jgi:molybdenum cofactor cytidylyltransferase
MISAIVLAAGRSQRMGKEKLFLPLGGKPVLQRVLESALASDLAEIVCVVRDLTNVRRHVCLANQRLLWLVNYAADRGQSSSVIAGLWAIHPKSDGAMFLVGDQPLVRSELIDALIERFEKNDALIVAPSFRGLTRNPVVFRRDIFPELLKLKGDRGGRSLIQKHRDQTAVVEWRDELPFMDLDVPADYERLKELE